MIHKNETLHSVPLWEIHIHIETQELIISKTFNYDDYNYGSVNQTFTLTATDSAGNSSSSSKTISIQKRGNPIAMQCRIWGKKSYEG